MCIFSRIGTPEKLKLTMSFRGDDFGQIAERRVVMWLDTTTGAEVKFGRAPRTGIERDILDAFQQRRE